jgi:Rho-binding antiterminator
MNEHPVVSCDLYDQLEAIAILKRQCCITYIDEEDNFTQIHGQIIDICAVDGLDWCKLGDGTVIRLDKIEAFESE